MFKHTKTLIAVVLLAASASQAASASTPVMLGNSASVNVMSTVAAVPGDDWFFSFGNGYQGDHVSFGWGWGFNNYPAYTVVRRPRIHRHLVVKTRRPFRRIRRGGRRGLRGRRIIIH